MRPIALGFLLLTLLLPLACNSREGFTIEGRVIDAETGKEVSRERMYLHFFCDEIDHQKSLDPRDATDFEVSMPKSKVRIRVADKSGRYHLFEQIVEIDGKVLEYDIAMVPTHYVLLTGRMVDRTTGKLILPKSGIGNTPLFSFSSESGFGEGMLAPDGKGSYSLRVPREKLIIRVVNTPLSVRRSTLDLTGHEGDKLTFDLELE